MRHLCALVGLAVLVVGGRAQTYSTTYNPTDLPAQSESGQSGTNECGTGFNETGHCQNAWVNSVSDFCLFASPTFAEIGVSERVTVSYCTTPKYGARSIPLGTLQAVHYLQAPDYLQISGFGNLTNLNIEGGDGGGELDPHGADGNGNPIGGLVFTTAFGGGGPLGIQIHEWTMFVSNDEFCVRLCKPGPSATTFCAHIYDELGCRWNIPGDYDDAGFTSCASDDVIPMGLYPQADGSTSTFFQGEPVTPSAHPPAASSSCSTFSSDIFAAAATSGVTTSTTASSSSASGSASGSGAVSGAGTGAGTASSTGASASQTGNAGDAGPRASSGNYLSALVAVAVALLCGTLVI